MEIFSVGNNEINESPDLNIGDTIKCPHCQGEHAVVGGKRKDGTYTNLILGYTCNGNTYLAGVDGKNIMKRFTDKLSNNG